MLTIYKSADYYGFGVLEEKIADERITRRYLDDLYRRVKKKTNNHNAKDKASKLLLDILAKKLKFKSFRLFEESLEIPGYREMNKFIGQWWSYVRANAGAFVLKAPLRIFRDEAEGKLKIEMQGGQQKFTGHLELRAQVLFCTLFSPKEKILHMVMKIGVNAGANVLQGIFSGISSAGDPIGGREVWVKEANKSFVEMNWAKLKLSDEMIEQPIRHYFSKYEGNCLKINTSSHFTYDDLLL